MEQDLSSDSKPENMEQAFRPLLELIDESLALDGIPVSQRQIRAARELVDKFIPSIRFGEDVQKSPGEFNEYSSEPWFKAIYGHVEKWYQNRYGTRLKAPTINVMRGVTLIASTPYELHVPVTASQVEVEFESAWLSFPPALVPGEDVCRWVVNPPMWDTYSEEENDRNTRTMSEVANLLRRISCYKTGATINDPLVRNLLAGVRVHLHSAAYLISREDEEGGYARAQWELQMACESAYKGFLQQKNGQFPEIHDLFAIHDLSKLSEQSVKRQWLKDIPRWNKAANLRYGIGDHPTVNGIFFWYKQTLRIIAGVFESLDRVDLTEARLLIRMAPWIDPALDKNGE